MDIMNIDSLWVLLLIVVIIPLGCFLAFGLSNIRDDQVGIKIRKLFGNQMPQGQIIARNKDDVGIQAEVLMPKLYWFNPITTRVMKSKMTIIPAGKVGLVEAIDGEPLPRNRLFGDHVDCNSYQEAKAFLDGKGKRGPQIEILRPGFYRINTALFKIALIDSLVVKEEMVGHVTAQDGQALPQGFVIAPKPTEDHKYFQDGQAFIDNGGYRGMQLDTLQPGEYYINRALFDVELRPITDVPPGYVGVLRSNVGQDLAKPIETPKPITKKPDFGQPIHEESEVVLSTDKDQRGIWIEPVAPGKYNMNSYALTAYLVPTSAVMIDWASGSEIRSEHTVDGRKQDTSEEERAREFFKFSQLRVTSVDGFQLEVDVRMIIRIRPQHASFVIARFGSVKNLIEQIVHPLIDSSFRNKAGEKKAIDFFTNRVSLQKEALERAKDEFSQYHVEAQNLLISYIKIPENLLITQTDKEIALQQQAQYEQQALAQEKRIVVKEKEARALKQPDVIAAKLDIGIREDYAEAMRKEAAGIRDKTKVIADGDAYQNKTVGQGIADAYQAQAEVIGPQILGLLKWFEQISNGQIKITPDVLVTGEGGRGNIADTLLAMLIKSGVFETVTPKKRKPVSEKKKVEESPQLPSLPIEQQPITPPSYDPEPAIIRDYPEPDQERVEKAIQEIETEAEEKRERWSPERKKTTRSKRA
jgi:regulator of protease activity HflC (stomatin/prohibitin superfamily)